MLTSFHYLLFLKKWLVFFLTVCLFKVILLTKVSSTKKNWRSVRFFFLLDSLHFFLRNRTQVSLSKNNFQSIWKISQASSWCLAKLLLSRYYCHLFFIFNISDPHRASFITSCLDSSILFILNVLLLFWHILKGNHHFPSLILKWIVLDCSKDLPCKWFRIVMKRDGGGG